MEQLMSLGTLSTIFWPICSKADVKVKVYILAKIITILLTNLWFQAAVMSWWDTGSVKTQPPLTLKIHGIMWTNLTAGQHLHALKGDLKKFRVKTVLRTLLPKRPNRWYLLLKLNQLRRVTSYKTNNHTWAVCLVVTSQWLKLNKTHKMLTTRMLWTIIRPKKMIKHPKKL